MATVDGGENLPGLEFRGATNPLCQQRRQILSSELAPVEKLILGKGRKIIYGGGTLPKPKKFREGVGATLPLFIGGAGRGTLPSTPHSE